MIFDLLESKINYHTITALRTKVRLNRAGLYTETIITGLREERKHKENIVNDPVEKRVNIKTERFIEITLIEKS